MGGLGGQKKKKKGSKNSSVWICSRALASAQTPPPPDIGVANILAKAGADVPPDNNGYNIASERLGKRRGKKKTGASTLDDFKVAQNLKIRHARFTKGAFHARGRARASSLVSRGGRRTRRSCSSAFMSAAKSCRLKKKL